MTTTIYKIIFDKISGRNYAKITVDDYKELAETLARDYDAYTLNGDKIPADYFDLRDWVYTRIHKDIKYQDTGYLNDHCCIGIIFGMIRLFEEMNHFHSFELMEV